MKEYIYIASNRSIPGMVKVGSTTASPHKRLSELQSTGVPTPFVLDISIAVSSAHESESAAHHALARYRVADNREFFRVSVPAAIKKILPVIGDYKIQFAKSSYGIEAIERGVEAKKQRDEERIEEARNAFLAELEEERICKQIKRQELAKQEKELKAAIKKEKTKLQRLGPRPVEKQLPHIAEFFSWSYYFYPFGWIVWPASLNVFFDGNEIVGIICVILLIGGYISAKIGNEYTDEYRQAEVPFVEIEKRISTLEGKLKKLQLVASNLSGHS